MISALMATAIAIFQCFIHCEGQRQKNSVHKPPLSKKKRAEVGDGTDSSCRNVLKMPVVLHEGCHGLQVVKASKKASLPPSWSTSHGELSTSHEVSEAVE